MRARLQQPSQLGRGSQSVSFSDVWPVGGGDDHITRGRGAESFLFREGVWPSSWEGSLVELVASGCLQGLSMPHCISMCEALSVTDV